MLCVCVSVVSTCLCNVFVSVKSTCEICVYCVFVKAVCKSAECMSCIYVCIHTYIYVSFCKVFDFVDNVCVYVCMYVWGN